MQQQQQQKKKKRRAIKVVVVGEGQVGKTALCRRLCTGAFLSAYSPTIGVEVHQLPLQIAASSSSEAEEELSVALWDCAGVERFGGLRDGYYVQADAALIVFDAASPASYRRVPAWHRDVCRVCGPALPCVVCCNKVDVAEAQRAVRPAEITWHVGRANVEYVELSVASCWRLVEPVQTLLRMLLRDPALEVGAVSAAPVVPADRALMQKYERELLSAAVRHVAEEKKRKKAAAAAAAAKEEEEARLPPPPPYVSQEQQQASVELARVRAEFEQFKLETAQRFKEFETAISRLESVLR